MNISQDEIEKIVNVVKEQLPDNFYPHTESIYNDKLMVRLCNGQLSLFEINEIQNRIEGWDIFISTTEGYLELIFRRH